MKKKLKEKEKGARLIFRCRFCNVLFSFKNFVPVTVKNRVRVRVSSRVRVRV